MTAVLAIDTASPQWIAVAFGETGCVARAIELEAPRDQSRQLLGLVESILADAGRPDALAVVTGPGSFAGLRVGIATVRGIGVGRGVPVYGVPTLDAVRAVAGGGDAAVVHPMGRDMVAIRRGSGPVQVVPASSLGESVAELWGEGAALLGGTEVTSASRCGAALGLVLTDLDAGRSPGEPTALYLREPNITKPRLSA